MLILAFTNLFLKTNVVTLDKAPWTNMNNYIDININKD